LSLSAFVISSWGCTAGAFRCATRFLGAIFEVGVGVVTSSFEMLAVFEGGSMGVEFASFGGRMGWNDCLAFFVSPCLANGRSLFGGKENVDEDLA
jgi:hypothetical protein